MPSKSDPARQLPSRFKLTRHIGRSCGFLGILLILLSASVALADCEQIDPLTLLPGEGICSGVVPDGDPMTAYTHQELYEIINGGAGVYIEHGFVAAAFQNYLVEIGEQWQAATLSLFNQGTAENAAALYEYFGEGDWDPITDWQGTGEARVNIAFGMTTLHFWEECFYSYIIVLSEEDEALIAARCLGETICAWIQLVVPAETSTWGRLKANY